MHEKKKNDEKDKSAFETRVREAKQMLLRKISRLLKILVINLTPNIDEMEFIL